MYINTISVKIGDIPAHKKANFFHQQLSKQKWALQQIIQLFFHVPTIVAEPLKDQADWEWTLEHAGGAR